MTVEVYSSPGAWLSTRFTATVNGTTAYVLGYSRTSRLDTFICNVGDSMEMSWLHFGANVTTPVVVTRLAGAITSVAIYPGNTGTTYTVVGSTITLQVPTNKRLRIELNGDRKNVLHIFANPLKPAVPAAKTNWTTLTPKSITVVDAGTDTFTTAAPHGWSNGQPVHITTTGTYPTAVGGDLTNLDVYYVVSAAASTFQLARTAGGAAIDLSTAGSGVFTAQIAEWSDTVNALYFPAGVHTIGRGFNLKSNTHVYIDGGAVVVGNFWTYNQTGIIVDGAGVVAGTFMTHEQVQALGSFSTKVQTAMFAGNGSYLPNLDNRLQNITLIASPYYCAYKSISHWRNVQHISPWGWETDGPNLTHDNATDFAGSIIDCFSYVGDDNLRIQSGPDWGPRQITVSGCFVVSQIAAAIHFGYSANFLTGEEDWNFVIEDVDVLHLSLGDEEGGDAGTAPRGNNAVFRMWMPAERRHWREKVSRVTVRRVRVWDLSHARVFALMNRTYPYSSPINTENVFGQIEDFTFEDVVVDTVPFQESIIEGTDRRNAPHEIHIDGLTIAGTLVTTRNYTDFFTLNAYPYRIYFEGTPVVTDVQLCNIALSHLGQKAIVTSLAPPDGSAESLLCATFYDAAVNTLLEMRSWGFALKRVALTLIDPAENSDIDGWLYAYAIPTGMLQAKAVLPPGSTDDYAEAGVKQPQPYSIELHSSGDLAIYTNVEDAVLRYTVYVTDPNFFPPLFQKALSWFLASELAGPLLKGEAGQAAAIRCINMANGYLSQAGASNGGQRQNDSQPNPSSIAAR